MSWIGDHVTRLEQWAKELLGHEDEKVRQIGDHVARTAAELRGDAPKLETEAEQDAADVAHTAATEGVIPAEQEAVKDGGTLLVDAGHDLAAAVEGTKKPAAETAAVATPVSETTA